MQQTHRSLRAVALACSVALGGLLAPPATARTLSCPDLDTVFIDGFQPRLAVDGLAQPGPFATTTVTGVTVRGARSIPWAATVPTAPGPPRALLLFAPGFQIPSSAYTSLMAHVATWGFVAVRADPVAPLFNTSHPEMALDLRAVLDDLLAPAALPIAVDGSRIAMSGHSLGGKLAVMVAGDDARVGAVYAFDPVNSDGANAGQPNILPQGIAAQTIPFGFAGELLDGAGGFQACAPLALNYQTFFDAAASTPAGYEWTLDGAGHMDFVTNRDQCPFICNFCQTGTLDTAVTHGFMRASTVAFLRTYLLDEPGLCRWLTGADVPLPISIRQRP